MIWIARLFLARLRIVSCMALCWLVVVAFLAIAFTQCFRWIGSMFLIVLIIWVGVFPVFLLIQASLCSVLYCVSGTCSASRFMADGSFWSKRASEWGISSDICRQIPL